MGKINEQQEPNQIEQLIDPNEMLIAKPNTQEEEKGQEETKSLMDSLKTPVVDRSKKPLSTKQFDTEQKARWSDDSENKKKLLRVADKVKEIIRSSHYPANE